VSLILHSIFLRNACILPNRLRPLRQPVGSDWARIEDLSAQIFSTMIRQAGWRFLRIPGPCVRKGIGASRDRAASNALARALKGIAGKFNAAELDSVQVALYLGLYVATVTLHPRQIGEQTSLDRTDDL
jgi:hypothetical protein